MEPSTERGQVLIECAVVVGVLITITMALMQFHHDKYQRGLVPHQIRDFKIYKNKQGRGRI